MIGVKSQQVPLGGVQVFEDLYCSHRDEVYGFLLARTGDPSLAEDLTADTFVAAWDRLQDCSRSPVTIEPGWLITVARRRLIDHWRRAERLRTRLQRLAGELKTASFVDDIDTKILEALASLSERQRAVMVLRYLDGYSVTEIAEVLGLTYKSTESLLSRGRAGLRHAYVQNETEEGGR